jgi:hypothetical protein
VSLSLMVASVSWAGPGCDGDLNKSVTGYFDAIRGTPNKLLHALTKFPKGADLHNHLSGAIAPDDYISLGKLDGGCFGRYTSNSTMVRIFSKVNCKPGSIKLEDATAKEVDFLKQSLSMYKYNDVTRSKMDGHDQFFATFVRFGEVSGSPDNTVPMIVKLLRRADADTVSYVETMVSFRSMEVGKLASQFSKKHQDPGSFSDPKNYPGMLEDLNSVVAEATPNLPVIASLARKDVDGYLMKAYSALNCDDKRLAAPGCGVTLTFQAAVNRNYELPKMFTQTALSFMLADSMPDKVVGVNLVSGEDLDNSMEYFAAQMDIFTFFHTVYPKVNIALHGGELTPCFLKQGISDPALKEHLTRSIAAGAKRLGHAVSFAYLSETDKESVARLMKENGVLIEVPFTSNAQILGAVATIKEHPYQDYVKRGVPVAFATDDEGVSYSDFTSEWIYAVNHYRLSFPAAQLLARSSLEYSFLPGASLWRNLGDLAVNDACAKEVLGNSMPGQECSNFLETSRKAKMQWEYEGDLNSYRAEFGETPWVAPR